MEQDHNIVSESDLFNTIKNYLKKNGHLNKIQAEMRAKVTEILIEYQNKSKSRDERSSIPKPTDEVLLINELIREYLEWNGYLYTSSVMASEANMPVDKRSRLELCGDVGVRDDEQSSALPLLSNIVLAYTERIKRKINKSKKET